MTTTMTNDDDDNDEANVGRRILRLSGGVDIGHRHVNGRADDRGSL